MRIKEALGLKRTSKTTEFNCPLTTNTAHQTMSLRKGVLKCPRDSSYTTSLAACSNAPPPWEEILPSIQSEPALAHLEAIPSCSISDCGLLFIFIKIVSINFNISFILEGHKWVFSHSMKFLEAQQ